MVKRILLRAGKGPFDVVSPEVTLRDNKIATNSGNLVFSHAAYKLLSTPATEIVPNYHMVSPADAARFNEEYDVFVVPLANAFRPGFEKHLIKLTELIEKLTIPVVVLGVGAQADLHYDLSAMAPLDDLVRRFVTAVLDRSPSIGVRGELTAHYLRTLGFRDVDVIGCPSMFLHGPQLHVEKTSSVLGRDARIALNISPHVEVAPYVEDHPYAQHMGTVVASHLRAYPNTTYIPQEHSALDLLLWGAHVQDADRRSDLPLFATHPLHESQQVRFYVDPWSWFAELADFDFAFGTRIHGNIAALLAGTPAYVIAHDSRTLELARYFDIPHTKITELGDDVDAGELYEAADFQPMITGHKERFDALTDFLGKHDLEHAFGESGGAAEFDKQVADLTFPAAVRPLDETNAKDRLRFLRDETTQLSRQISRVQSKVNSGDSDRKKLTKTVEKLRSEQQRLVGAVDEMSSSHAALTERVQQLERAAARRTPWRRLRRRVGRVLRHRRRRR